MAPGGWLRALGADAGALLIVASALFWSTGARRLAGQTNCWFRGTA